MSRGIARHSVLLNFCWLGIYFTVFFSLNFTVNSATLFSSSDAQEYLAASTEFYHLGEKGISLTRPFLYPAIILVCFKIFGATGLWLVQLLLWLGCANLLYRAVANISGRPFLGVIASMVFALNLSGMALTLHALTETACLFLLSLLLYVVSARAGRLRSPGTFLAVLFLLVLLTLIKPLFIVPLCITLLAFPALYFRPFLAEPRHFGFLALALLPLLLQLGLMKITYNTFSVSAIGRITFVDYFLSRGIMETEALSWQDAQGRARALSASEAKAFILSHKKLYAGVYGTNLKENIRTGPPGFLFPESRQKALAAALVYRTNAFYYYCHLLFALPVLLLAYFTFRKKEWHYLALLLFSAFMGWYILLASGISFAQGDRLAMPALPCFSVAYALVISSFISLTNNGNKPFARRP